MLDYALILLLILAAGSVFFQFKMQSSLVKIKEIRDKVTQLNDRVLQLAAQMGSLEKNQEKADTAFREEMARNREEISAKLEHIRSSVDLKLRQLQEDNSKKLEEMRATVDDKLHHALEQKLSESFKLVSERLEQVYKGLGEMQNLAVGVGDLKKCSVTSRPEESLVKSSWATSWRNS